MAFIVYKGKPYRSLTNLYTERKRKGEVEVSLHKIKRLIKDGFSLEEAFDIDINAYSTHFKSKRKGKKVIVEGVEYKTLTDLAKAYGVTIFAISKARARGKKGDDVIPEYKRKSYVFFEHKGKKFKSRKEACKYYNVTESAFRYRRRKRGLTIEQSLGLEKVARTKYGNSVEVDGKKFKSRKEACKYYAIPESTFTNRKRKGWTIEQCLGLEKVARNLKGNSVEIDGKKFGS